MENSNAPRFFGRRKFVVIGVMTVAAVLAGCSKQAETVDDKKTVYTCSMHPQIRSNKPGRCPICGMNLTPIVPAPEQQSSTEEHGLHDDKAEVRLMPAQDSVASIVTQPVAALALVHTAATFGEIRAVQDANVDFTWVYSGRVERLLAPYNTTEVNKGEPLLEIYSEEAIADQQAYLQAVRERYLTTFYERKIATAQIETFRAKLARAGMTDLEFTDLERNKKIKTHFTIIAPISGSITSNPPSIGERVTPEKVLYRISQLGKVWFAAKVFEQDMSSLEPGQEINIETKARAGKTYRGKLVFIDRAIDPETRTVIARFEIENPKRELLPAMSATGYLKSRSAESLVVPTSAVIDTGRRKIVYVQTAPHTYRQREIVAGNEGGVEGQKGIFVEVKSGLEKGDQVVASGAFLIDAEAQLRGASSEHKH